MYVTGVIAFVFFPFSSAASTSNCIAGEARVHAQLAAQLSGRHSRRMDIHRVPPVFSETVTVTRRNLEAEDPALTLSES
jgi:hypothetical protein